MKKIFLFSFLLSASVQAQIVGGNFFTSIELPESKCGANLSAGYFRQFMCHNLGADGSLDYTIPTQGLNGNYYQWGTKAAVATASGLLGSWSNLPTVDNSWSDEGIKGPADPCPNGFRLPSKKQWDGVIANNTFARTASWANNNSFTAVLQITADALAGKGLVLPTAGYRSAADGSLLNRGAEINYWSSTPNGVGNAYLLQATASSNPIAAVGSAGRNQGASIRCIEDLKCRMRTKQTQLGGQIVDDYTTFMCHNLGADTNLDPDNIVQGIHGDYYQWGSKTPAATTTAIIGNWNPNRVVSKSDWDGDYKTPNDPCPRGFRIPLKTDFFLIKGGTSSLVSVNGVLNNSFKKIGAWDFNGNFTSGFTMNPNNPKNKKFTFTGSGYRSNTTGAVINRGYDSLYYWGSSWLSTDVNPGCFTISESFQIFSSSNSTTPANAGLPVRCVEYPVCTVRMTTNPVSYKEWMCFNLGASLSSTTNNGNYYQWGKKIEAANSVGITATWNSSAAGVAGSWLEATKGTEDPCPAGFKVPSRDQWNAAIASNALVKTGSWVVNSGFGSLLYFMPDDETISLSLAAAGYRLPTNGSLLSQSALGYYWTSTIDTSPLVSPIYSYVLKINGNANPSAVVESNLRSLGASVRCIAE